MTATMNPEIKTSWTERLRSGVPFDVIANIIDATL